MYLIFICWLLIIVEMLVFFSVGDVGYGNWKGYSEFWNSKFVTVAAFVIPLLDHNDVQIFRSMANVVTGR